MNCQEFRQNWIHGKDDATLFHIETCDDCLHWIETQNLHKEEVAFLKEFPKPSPQLEDKIMQAIYETSGKEILPPHSAAQQLVKEQNRSLPRMRRLFFSSTAWVSAAAVLLVVGTVSYQALHNNQSTSNQALEQAAPAASNALASQSADNKTAHSNTETANQETKQETTTEPTGGTISKSPNPIVQEAPAKPILKQPARETGSVLAMAPNLAAAPKTEMSSRSKVQLPMTEQSAENTAQPPSIQAEQPALPKDASQPPVNSLAPDMPEQNATSAQTLVPEQTNPSASVSSSALPDTQKMMLADTVSSQTARDVTISTFTEVETAVQASDMPIPAFEHLPDSFALDSLSLQYESETSKHVIGISSVYGNGKDQFTVDVKPVDGDKQISIPGVFTDRQLFSVNGDQAIGVTYQLPPTSSTSEHAIHFIHTQGNQHLYVIITGRGGSLERMIEVAKHTIWKK